MNANHTHQRKESGVPVYMLGDTAIPTNIISNANGKSPFFRSAVSPAMRPRNMMKRTAVAEYA